MSEEEVKNQEAESSEATAAAGSENTNGAASQAAPSEDAVSQGAADSVAAADEEPKVEDSGDSDVVLDALFASKLGMSATYDENGQQVPVTVLKLSDWKVTQVKTLEKDGYEAVQVATFGKADKNVSKAQRGHLKACGEAKAGPSYTREIRQALPDGVKPGLSVSWGSLVKGDKVKLTATSKGRGFSGVMKRWNFGGGPAAHGSKFHRQPGSIGNCTFPGRVMAGRKMPGRFGNDTVSVKNVQIVDVQVDSGLILVKGPVPGARNGLVKLMKQQ